MKKSLMLGTFFWLMTSAIAVGQQRVMPHDSIGCKRMDVTLQIGRMMLSNDYASFKSYSTDMVKTGECKIFSKGDRVIVEKTDGPASCLKPSSGTCFWAPVEF
jgi:hypothetical protein